MKRFAIIVLLLLCGVSIFAEAKKDSCSLEISLLTCAPGADLYSIFGHTAIRIRDSARRMDVVYNYGTFDDTDPLFYVHFTRGIMNYSLSAETFDSFMMEYQTERRSVTAQILNLNSQEKIHLYEALRKNTLDENRLYQYHFHTDNCTTRAGKIIESSMAPDFEYKNILPDQGPTYRDMIYEYLNPQHQYWSRFGIDLCLGMNLDIKPSNTQAIHFLPDYLFRGMDSARNSKGPMVAGKQVLIGFPKTAAETKLLTPMFTLVSLFIISLALYLSKNEKILAAFDIFFFGLMGLFGLLITYLWLGRVDDVCRKNMNVLWALPTHLVAVFFLKRKISWIKYYFLFTAVLSSILLIGFPWWPQRIDTAVLPILGTIIFRGFSLFKNRKDAEKNIVQR